MKAMENKKEPLMSADEFFVKNKPLSSTVNVIKLMNGYANYVTQWHLNNAKEFVADSGYYKTAIGQTLWEISDKQSIHTAIDNYIEINLNKEL